MQRISRRRLLQAGLASLATLPVLSLATKGVAGETASEMKIGLPANLFRDFPKITVDALLPTFSRLMETQTGFRGKPVLLSGTHAVGNELAENKVQLGVFHGFEFAWAQVRHSDLKPLVIAVNQTKQMSAQVVVANDPNVKKLEDLKGKDLAIPRGTREHCRLFLSRRCRGIGQKQESLFGKITNPIHVSAALDDVVRGKVAATVVDTTAWENYKWLSPANAARLKLLISSEAFPTGVIGYKEGVLTETNLKKFKEGLVTAHQRPEGLQLMMLWKMSKFEDIPADYPKMLAEIAQAYPPPIGDEP